MLYSSIVPPTLGPARHTTVLVQHQDAAGEGGIDARHLDERDEPSGSAGNISG